MFILPYCLAHGEGPTGSRGGLIDICERADDSLERRRETVSVLSPWDTTIKVQILNKETLYVYYGSSSVGGGRPWPGGKPQQPRTPCSTYSEHKKSRWTWKSKRLCEETTVELTTSNRLQMGSIGQQFKYHPGKHTKRRCSQKDQDYDWTYVLRMLRLLWYKRRQDH